MQPRNALNLSITIKHLIQELDSHRILLNSVYPALEEARQKLVEVLQNKDLENKDKINIIRSELLAVYDDIVAANDLEHQAALPSLEMVLHLLALYWPLSNNCAYSGQALEHKGKDIPSLQGYLFAADAIVPLLRNENNNNAVLDLKLKESEIQFLSLFAEATRQISHDARPKGYTIGAGLGSFATLAFFAGMALGLPILANALPFYLALSAIQLTSYAFIQQIIAQKPSLTATSQVTRLKQNSFYNSISKIANTLVMALTAPVWLLAHLGQALGSLVNQINKRPAFKSAENVKYLHALFMIQEEAKEIQLRIDQKKAAQKANNNEQKASQEPVPLKLLTANHLFILLNDFNLSKEYKLSLLQNQKNEIIEYVVEHKLLDAFIAETAGYKKQHPEIYYHLQIINLRAYRALRGANEAPKYLHFYGSLFGFDKDQKVHAAQTMDDILILNSPGEELDEAGQLNEQDRAALMTGQLGEIARPMLKVGG